MSYFPFELFFSQRNLRRITFIYEYKEKFSLLQVLDFQFGTNNFHNRKTSFSRRVRGWVLRGDGEIDVPATTGNGEEGNSYLFV